MLSAFHNSVTTKCQLIVSCSVKLLLTKNNIVQLVHSSYPQDLATSDFGMFPREESFQKNMIQALKVIQREFLKYFE